MTTAVDLYGRPWSEKELIVTLHYYFKYQGHPRHSGCDYIQDLSRILGRTPGAIVMRMENYASIDPTFQDKRVGLINITPFGKRVFNHWLNQKDALTECAEAFIRDSASKSIPTLFDPCPIRIPRAFGKYELIDKLGEGASGMVFSCLNSDDDTAYAIKIIHAEGIHDPSVFHRFLREIRALKAVDHPNIINLHEDNLESEKQFPAFVMDLASHSLTSYVEQVSAVQPQPMSPVLPFAEAACVFQSMLDAVESLHSNVPRLIHRDINPNNVLRLPDGRWVLADFGLAKFLSTAPVSTSFRTTTQRGWGTMWYTAPEQYRDFGKADEKSDIYPWAC